MTSTSTTTLGEASYINPRLTAPLDNDASIAFVPMAAVSSEEARIIAPGERPYREVKKGYTYFESGDVLVAKITPCFENGKIAQAILPHKIGFGSTEFHVVRPKHGVSDGRYLHHYLRQPHIRLAGERRMTGSGGQRRVPEDYLASLLVPLPPVAEQRRIAAVLDQADALRAQRRQALAELDRLAQAVFVEMFADAMARPARDALGSLVQEFRYGTSEKSSESGFPALRIPNVANGYLDLSDLKTVPVTEQELDRLRLKDGDLLFVRTNGNPEYVGRCAVFNRQLTLATGFKPDEFIYASYLIRARLREDTISPVVLQRYLHEGEGRRALRAVCKTSAGQYNVNVEGLGGIQIPRFPKGLQEIFAERLQRIELLKEAHHVGVAEADALFSSIQHRAFTGAL